MATFFSTVWLILRKDLLTELRTREVISTMGLFALLTVVVFAFAFSVDEVRARLVTSGIIWVILLFASTLGVNRVFDQEQQSGGLLALCLGPAGPVAVYVAKALGIFLFTVIAQLLTVPLMLIFLSVEVPEGGVGLLIIALLLGSVAVAEVGTLFAAMLANARLREVLLPLLVYPIVLPAIIAGVELTEIAMGGGLPETQMGWIQLMAGFDLIFSVIPAWVFGRVMID
ncbi:MAG: heme exporter protein CcmB [Myxococcota bacterium]